MNPAPQPSRSVPGTPAVDVVVVGAGVIGLAAAWELRRRGRTVAVVDPDPGGGASLAAAGMLAPASEVQYSQEPLYPLMAASAAEYPTFVSALEAAAGASVGYRRTETLVCGADAADRQALADLRLLQMSCGTTVEQVSLRTARTLEPALSPRLSSVFRIPSDHQVDPRRLTAALLGALVAPGGTESCPSGRTDGGPAVLIGASATGLLWGGGAVTGVVLEDGRELAAAQTLLAAGTGLSRLHGLPSGYAPPLRPVHGDILRTRLPAGAPPLLEHTVRGLVHGVPVYLVPRSDGTIVIGATSREDGRNGASAGGVFALLRDAQTLVPAVADLDLVEVMARARPATPDDRPYLGALRRPDGTPVPGVAVSTGFSRHGVLLAPLAARLAAQLLTGMRGSNPAADARFLAAADPHRFNHSSPNPPAAAPAASPPTTPPLSTPPPATSNRSM